MSFRKQFRQNEMMRAKSQSVEAGSPDSEKNAGVSKGPMPHWKPRCLQGHPFFKVPRVGRGIGWLQALGPRPRGLTGELNSLRGNQF
jgi:hypothetical protein